MKFTHIPLFAVVAFAGTTAAQAQTVYNATPDTGWFYGDGNDYAPANTAVHSTGSGQIYLRAHETFQPASASDGSGVYSFALGTSFVSFDWGIDDSVLAAIKSPTALLTFTNIGTSGTFSYDPFFTFNDNETNGFASQNSNRLNYIPGIAFNPTGDSTYKVTLDIMGPGGGVQQSLSVFAKLGAGAGAVPEPSTWALMILGFGLVGGAMRSAKRREKLTISYS